MTVRHFAKSYVRFFSHELRGGLPSWFIVFWRIRYAAAFDVGVLRGSAVRSFVSKEAEWCGGVLVGTGRFELPTPRTPSECSTRLSHVPTRKEPAAMRSAASGVDSRILSLVAGFCRTAPVSRGQFEMIAFWFTRDSLRVRSGQALVPLVKTREFRMTPSANSPSQSQTASLLSFLLRVISDGRAQARGIVPERTGSRAGL
jgi:hypothetical protein